MEEIINQIIKIFEDNNLSVAQAKTLLSMAASELDGKSIIKIKKTN
jgi:hypothetical protein